MIPTRCGFVLGAGFEVPSLPPRDLQHVPNQTAIVRAAGTQAAASPEASDQGKLKHQTGAKRECAGPERGPGARAREQPSLSGRARAASRRVEELRPAAAATRCLFPRSLPLGGGGGGEVTSAPRLAPRPGRGQDSPAGRATPAVAAAGAELRGVPVSAVSLARCSCGAGETPALLLRQRLLGAGERGRSSHSAPEPPGAPLRAPPRLAEPLRRRFPRRGLQVMLFLFCS